MGLGTAEQPGSSRLPPIDIHGRLQEAVLRELERCGFKCVTAPTEADFQLWCMFARGLIQGVITDDSDLLMLGCDLMYVSLKRDGDVEEIRWDDMWKACPTLPVDEPDPLDWLVEMSHGIDARARAAYRLHACIAHSDFNVIPFVGNARAIDLVLACDSLFPADSELEGIRPGNDGLTQLVSAAAEKVYEVHRQYAPAGN